MIVSKIEIGIGQTKLDNVIELFLKAKNKGASFITMEYDNSHKFERYHFVRLNFINVDTKLDITNQIEELENKITELKERL